MIPASIVSGFRLCGVYPFNPKAVHDHSPCVSRSENLNLVILIIPVIGEDDLHQPSNTGSDTTICRDEKEIRYQTKYLEGYNLHDLKYISWLKIYHPGENCETFSLMECFPNASMSGNTCDCIC